VPPGSVIGAHAADDRGGAMSAQPILAGVDGSESALDAVR